MNWKLAIFILLIGYGAYQHYADRPVVTTDGSLNHQLPAQNNTDSPTFQYKHYTITSLAQFALKARVLAREDY